MKNLIRELILESLQELRTEGVFSLKKLKKSTYPQSKKDVDEITTTGAVQGYMTPGAFKPTRKKKSVKEYTFMQMGTIELIRKALSKAQFDKNIAVDLLQKEFQRVDGSKKKIYQSAIDYLAKMNNSDIKNMVREEEQPEPYDAETDMFAPGPRQRPEDWDIMNKKMKQRTDPENKFDDDPDDIK